MNSIISFQEILDNSESENIQLQCLELLAAQTELFTKGESSSIKIEKAQSILQSIFFTLEIHFNNITNFNNVLTEAKNNPMNQLFEQGREIIKFKLQKSLKLLEMVRANQINTDNIAYNDTLGDGLELFFSQYDPEFSAHETPGSIDYPLSHDKMGLKGVSYIYNYLHTLYLENEFCNNFSTLEINCMLRGYHKNYKDLLINIFTQVIINLTGRVLSGRNSRNLSIEPCDRNYIEQQFSSKSNTELHIILQAAAKKICLDYNITNEFLKKYITDTVMDILPGLLNAFENGHLELLFISLDNNIPQADIEYTEGKKMEDELFRKVTDEIRSCRYISDKISIIKREVQSITDLIDVFDADCIFSDEYVHIFDSLDDLELAMLLKHLNNYESQKEWQHKLKKYFDIMNLVKKDNIEQLKDKMDSRIF